MSKLVSKKYLIPFVLITSLFFMWGFARAILDVLNKHFQETLDITRAQWDEVMSVNVTGTFFMSQQMGRHLVATGRTGAVISLASTHGVVGYPELILMNLPETDPLRKPLLEIKKSGEKAVAIVQDLLPYDVFITPTLTQPPRPTGYYDMNMTDLDAYNALWSDAMFLFPFNISGQPAMSLPLGMTTDGLPLGVQIVGRQGAEGTLLAIATLLEQAMPWHDRRPLVHA